MASKTQNNNKRKKERGRPRSRQTKDKTLINARDETEGFERKGVCVCVGVCVSRKAREYREKLQNDTTSTTTRLVCTGAVVRCTSLSSPTADDGRGGRLAVVGPDLAHELVEGLVHVHAFLGRRLEEFAAEAADEGVDHVVRDDDLGRQIGFVADDDARESIDVFHPHDLTSASVWSQQSNAIQGLT